MRLAGFLDARYDGVDHRVSIPCFSVPESQVLPCADGLNGMHKIAPRW